MRGLPIDYKLWMMYYDILPSNTKQIRTKHLYILHHSQATPHIFSTIASALHNPILRCQALKVMSWP